MGVTLFVLNDAPYAVERSYNGLRLAGSLAKRDGEQVWLFLVGDAVACARAAQKGREGYYNLELMPRSVSRRGGKSESVAPAWTPAASTKRSS